METDLITTLIDFAFGFFTAIFGFLFDPVTGIISMPYENFLRTVLGTVID